MDLSCRNGTSGQRRNKKDEEEKMEEVRQQKVAQMIETSLQHGRRRAQIVKIEEADARLLDRCEAKRKEWAKHWQCESVQNMEEKALEK